VTGASGWTLRVGFISCDFNDHPTAHLVEAIFSVFAKMRAARDHHHFKLIVFSYGKDDNSIYRHNLQKVFFMARIRHGILRMVLL
jgi:predicted O-linked N-acetylglucosamine transferase (SPINDLY family)